MMKGLLLLMIYHKLASHKKNILHPLSLISKCFPLIVLLALNISHIFYINSSIVASNPEQTFFHYFFRLAAIDILVFVIFFSSSKIENYFIKHNIQKQILGSLLCFFTPLLTFLSVELIADCRNLLGIEYIIKNLVIYYILFAVLCIPFHKTNLLLTIYFSFFAVIGLTYYFVLSFRGRPFTLQDITAWKTALTVAGNYKFYISETVFTVLSIAIIVLLFFKQLHFTLQKKFGIFVKLVCISFAIIPTLICHFQYDKFYASLSMWDLYSNYQNFGLVVTLLSEIPYIKVSAPENYSIKTVEDIMNNVEYTPHNANTTQPQNIILIMNESFADLDYISTIQSDTEILPFWKSMKENTISGYLNMPVFGAGTANAEYEVLTGNSIHFLASGSTPYQLNVKNNEYSLVSTLKAQGYTSIALHPYWGDNWNRKATYANMGFDEFYTLENCWLDNPKYIRSWISDSAAYDTIISLCEENEDKLFTFLVTMQNHGGYENSDIPASIHLNYDTYYPEAEQYFSLLHGKRPIIGRSS